MNGWTEERIKRAHQLIGKKKFLLAQRGNITNSHGTDDERFRDMASVAMATENQASAATALRRLLLEQIDASIEGIDASLRAEGVSI